MPATTPLYTLSDFDCTLPEGYIAQYPLPQRDHARMMVLDRACGGLQHQHAYDLPNLLTPGDLLVLNNAKVIPARLHGVREGHTGQIELFLMHPEDALRTCWQVLMRPARKLKPGTRILFPHSSLQAEILDRSEGGRGRIRLEWPAEESLEKLLDQVGTLPIPPYLARETEELDRERYQTVFAKVPGAQAAPTAGLHFTSALLDHLQAKGIGLAEVTLHVSAGTFRPVLSEDIDAHQMDPEFYSLSPEAAQAITQARARGHRIVAVGTTVAKTLETIAAQHEGSIVPCSGWSDLFITPGFPYQAVDALLTNFHLPKSTLLMLVSAFANRDFILQAYQTAIAERYRFYSYGDCMLIL